jgi:hypothetical protein
MVDGGGLRNAQGKALQMEASCLERLPSFALRERPAATPAGVSKGLRLSLFLKSPQVSIAPVAALWLEPRVRVRIIRLLMVRQDPYPAPPDARRVPY